MEVSKNAHARFDAKHRAYEYHIAFHKNPFLKETAFYFRPAKKLKLKKLNEAAALLLEYEAYFPFCKTNSDVKTMNCELKRSEWLLDEENDKLVFHISSNRFLRGMVRLIVGMCLNVAHGKTNIEEVRKALESQSQLSKSYSVPPQGLFLTDIRYPFQL